MNIRFTKHALKRIRERFAFCIEELVKVIDHALSQNSWIYAEGQRKAIEGSVRGNRIRVIYQIGLLGQVTIVTVMWRNTHTDNWT